MIKICKLGWRVKVRRKRKREGKVGESGGGFKERDVVIVIGVGCLKTRGES